MTSTLRSLTIFVALATGFAAFAATPSDFYMNLLRRGVADVESGAHARGVSALRIAAFGLVESVEQYQRAQVYLTIGQFSLGRRQEALQAARRVVETQRLGASLKTQPISPLSRDAFQRAAESLLTVEERASLNAAPAQTRSAAAERTTPPAEVTAIPPARTTPASQPVTEKSAEQTTQNTASPAKEKPAEPVAQKPAPAATQKNTAPATQRVAEAPAQKPAPPATQKGAEPVAQKVAPTASKAAADPARSQPSPSEVQQKPVEISTVTVETVKRDPQAAAPSPKPGTAAGQTSDRTTAPTNAAPTSATTPLPVRKLTAAEVATNLARANAELEEPDLASARTILRELLETADLDRTQLIAVTQGLYRARDFAGAITGFERLGTLRASEQPYRYYLAVALFEVGRFADAARELDLALPHIEVTPDVERNRSKILGAVR